MKRQSDLIENYDTMWETARSAIARIGYQLSFDLGSISGSGYDTDDMQQEVSNLITAIQLLMDELKGYFPE